MTRAVPSSAQDESAGQPEEVVEEPQPEAEPTRTPVQIAEWRKALGVGDTLKARQRLKEIGLSDLEIDLALHSRAPQPAQAPSAAPPKPIAPLTPPVPGIRPTAPERPPVPPEPAQTSAAGERMPAAPRLQLPYFGYDVFKSVPAAFGPSPYGQIDSAYAADGKVGPIRVFVLGQVAGPGAYTVGPNAGVFNTLYAVGGPAVTGSLRAVKVIRDGRAATVADLYPYLLGGDDSADIRLLNDDAILVPARGRTVAIDGEVRRPGFYELRDGERLKSLLQFAGGLKPTAHVDRIQIDRIVPFGERGKTAEERRVVDVELSRLLGDPTADVDLFDGDTVSLYPIQDQRKNVVTIEGAVVRPGDYELYPGETAGGLIDRAGGLLGEVYLQKADVLRTRQDKKAEQISLDLAKVLDGDPRFDVSLQRLDRLRVYSIHEMAPRKSVRISGHVLHPGEYPLLEKMTLYDVVFKAGGLIDSDYRKRTYLDRADLVRVAPDSVTRSIVPFNLGRLLDGDPAVNDTLRAGDEVVIYGTDEILGGSRVVTVSGHVKRPGAYELYEENMTIRDLLFRAGGLQDPGFRMRTYLERADLLRLNDDRVTRRVVPFDLGGLLDGEETENYHLLPQDEVRVYSVETVRPETREVSILGAVKNPGKFPLETNMTLKDLILQAGGFTEDAYLHRAEIARVDPRKSGPDSLTSIIEVDLDPGFETPQVQSVASPGGPADVAAVFPWAASSGLPGWPVQGRSAGADLLDRREPSGFLLQNFDMVYIRVHPDYQYQRNVTLAGEVRFPGSYALRRRGERVSELIERAGGLRSEASLPAARFVRNGERLIIDIDRALRRGGRKADIPLIAGDLVSIPPSSHTVTVEGEVGSPGLFKQVDGLRALDYIARAGGLTESADWNRIYVEQPTGIIKKVRGSGPKVTDGSVIRVGARPPRKEGEPTDWNALLKDVSVVMTGFATTALVVTQATR